MAVSTPVRRIIIVVLIIVFAYIVYHYGSEFLFPSGPKRITIPGGDTVLISPTVPPILPIKPSTVIASPILTPVVPSGTPAITTSAEIKAGTVSQTIPVAVAGSSGTSGTGSPTITTVVAPATQTLTPVPVAPQHIVAPTPVVPPVVPPSTPVTEKKTPTPTPPISVPLVVPSSVTTGIKVYDRISFFYSSIGIGNVLADSRVITLTIPESLKVSPDVIVENDKKRCSVNLTNSSGKSDNKFVLVDNSKYPCYISNVILHTGTETDVVKNTIISKIKQDTTIPQYSKISFWYSSAGDNNIDKNKDAFARVITLDLPVAVQDVGRFVRKENSDRRCIVDLIPDKNKAGTTTPLTLINNSESPCYVTHFTLHNQYDQDIITKKITDDVSSGK